MKLSRDQNITRYAAYKKQLRDENDQPVGVLPQAFTMRPIDKGKLSVNWVEYHDGEYEDQLKSVVADFRTKRDTRPSGIFVIANVGVLMDECGELKANRVKVIGPDGKKKGLNPSHASINDLPENDAEIMQCLAAKVFVSFIKASEY